MLGSHRPDPGRPTSEGLVPNLVDPLRFERQCELLGSSRIEPMFGSIALSCINRTVAPSSASSDMAVSTS